MIKEELMNRLTDIEWENFEVKQAENAGYGFDKMISGWKPYAHSEPEFEVSIDLTIVKFYFPVDTRTSGSEEATAKTTVKTTVKILEIIKEDKHVTRQQLAGMLGMTIDGIDWNIKKLRNEGILKRVGPAKGGHWEIISK